MWRVYHAKEMLVLILRHGTSYITKHTKSMIIQKKNTMDNIKTKTSLSEKIVHIIKTETPSTVKRWYLYPKLCNQ